ncbi:leucine-rich repeat domain-containing protein [Treponema medium]|nr:leucine-rich repeat domain-containing protein [Treponema medium]
MNGTNNSYQLKIEKAVTVKVSFEALPPGTFAVNFGVDGSNGTLNATVDGKEITNGSGAQKDKTVIFTATPNDGYEVDKWNITGDAFETGTGTNGSLTAKVNITKETTVKVSFKLKKYLVTFSIDGTGGTLKAEVDGTVINTNDKVEHGKQVTFTAKASDGYRVKSWMLDGKPITEAGTNTEYKLTVTKPATVSVSFVLTYAAAFSVEGSGGTLKAKAEGEAETETSPINVEKDKTVTFTATPNTDYMVDTWTVTPSAALQEGGTEGSTTAKVKITEATTVKVSFTKYKKIAYGTNGDDLKNYLTTASPASDGIYYIEVTGLKAEHLKGTFPNPGPLGQILKDHPTKKVALKLPKKIEGLTDMSSCFQQCASLVQVRNIPQGVTNMHSCFMDCSSLVKAPAIPQGVTSMQNCFYDCTNLKEPPAIPDTVTDMRQCFMNCGSLTKAPSVLPDGVTNMNQCFAGCGRLTKAPAIPQNVVSMQGSFQNCGSLIEAPEIPQTVTYIGYCFANCTNLKEPPAIPDTVTDMRQCFMNCGSLTKAPSVLPDGVTNMNQCFAGCGRLTKAPAIPQNVVSMQGSFQNCGSLIEAPEIPQTVTYIGYCFEGCGKIKGVVLKCNYRDGSFFDLFQNCASLEDGGIKVPAGQLQDYKDHANKMKTTEKKFGVRVAYAELSAFLAGTNSSAADVNYIEVTGLTKADLEERYNDSCKLGDKLKAHPTKKVALELPKEVEGLTDTSFRTCTSLVSVRNIPKSVRSMKNCFSSCTSLKYVSEVPSGIMDMQGCFLGCTALTEAPTIPSGVTNMIKCFSGCTALTSVTLKCNYDPVNVSLENTFQNCTALGEKSIKVPQAYYGNYTTADALEKMKVPGTDETEKRAKFEGV